MSLGGWITITLPNEVGHGHKNFPSAFVLGKRPIHFYPKPEREHRALVQALLKEQWNQPPLLGAVQIHYLYEVPIPASWSKRKKELARQGKIRPTSTPDLSNLMYWMENRLKGILFQDDCQVIFFSCREKYSDEPKTTILIQELLSPELNPPKTDST